ncbi:MAG TPA: AAA family ATPase [Fibrobacteria bacterium]|nr:AAA family ATPase [Fibrobacteria bacterium]
MIPRQSTNELDRLASSSRGRLAVVSGARQVGKTTLVRRTRPDWTYLDLDDPVTRPLLANLTAQDWLSRYRNVIVDEVQKLPSLFETFKACHDRDPEFRAILLGSSQLLVLKGVRESLAGRAAMLELFPLMLSEIVAHRAGREPDGKIGQLLTSGDPAGLLDSWADPLRRLDPVAAIETAAWERMKIEGGMPVLWANDDWTESDKRLWREDYVRTYLQKDLADVARLEHLEPFVRLLRMACLRTAQTANWSDLASDAGVSSPSAKTWMSHLEAGYHAVLLQPWFRNREKRLAKSPKVHILDAGVRRAVLRKSGEPDGAEFETAVVGEFWKAIKTQRLPVDPYHLRTVDGREIDLLIERDDGYFAIECKSTRHAEASDARHFSSLETILDKPLLAGLVVSDDADFRRLDAERPVWAVPASAIAG